MWSRDSAWGSDPPHPTLCARAGTESLVPSVFRSQSPLVKNYSQEPCPYSQESKKFSCQLKVPEGDNSYYIVSLCVANHVGSKTSKSQAFHGFEIRT